MIDRITLLATWSGIVLVAGARISVAAEVLPRPTNASPGVRATSATNVVRLREPVRAAPSVQSNAIRPTVTLEMGDVGGRFFGAPPDPATTRRYFIAVEPELWNFLPEGRDVICGKPLPPDLLARRNSGKLRYVQYTDASFTTRVLPEPRLGILGPVLRGVVGEHLAITLLNRASLPVSMHPHGVRYDKDSEGAYYEPRPGLGAAVGPGARFTYVWKLNESSGPLPHEPSSKGWLYHSHVRGDEDANLGLVGFLIVTDPARARPDGTPADVDREMAALFMMFDESGEEDEAAEAAEYAALPMGAPPPKPWAQIQELIEQGQRPAINGRIFGNLRGLEMNEGERVRWYLFGLGSEEDFHTAHWHGLTVLEENQRRTDVVELLPASMKIADLLADNPGAWLFHCHVAEHMARGMFANVEVHPKNKPRARREPAHAFFGLPKGEESLRIKRAAATLTEGEGRIRIEAECTVYQAFSVFVEPVLVQFGGRSVRFKPDRRGQARTGADEIRITNASAFGVVYGGSLEFELTLADPGWRAELDAAGGGEAGAAPARLRVPVRVQIGPATHAATAEVEITK